MCRMGFRVQLEIKSIFRTARRVFRDFKTLIMLEILSKNAFSTTPQNGHLTLHPPQRSVRKTIKISPENLTRPST